LYILLKDDREGKRKIKAVTSLEVFSKYYNNNPKGFIIICFKNGKIQYKYIKEIKAENIGVKDARK
jgi:hypothetical protein